MSTASTRACTGRSPAPSVSTIRRRVESARTSNTTDSTWDAYTYVYIHFSAALEQSQGFLQPWRESFDSETAVHLEHKLMRSSAFMGTEGDALERPKRGKETAVVNRNLQERLVRGLNLN